PSFWLTSYSAVGQPHILSDSECVWHYRQAAFSADVLRVPLRPHHLCLLGALARHTYAGIEPPSIRARLPRVNGGSLTVHSQYTSQLTPAARPCLFFSPETPPC